MEALNKLVKDCTMFVAPSFPWEKGRGRGAAGRPHSSLLPNPLPKGEGVRTNLKLDDRVQ
jgi:hypothetical protein